MRKLTDDCIDHGRKGYGLGTSNGRTVLTEEQVVEIRTVYIKGSKQFGLPALSRRYGISVSQVKRVVDGVHHAKVN